MQVSSANSQRRSIRLKDYDYSQPGSYFVTICTHGHEYLFGNIVTVRVDLLHTVRAGSEPARTQPAHTDIAQTDPTRTNFPQFQSSKLDSAELIEMNLNPFGEIVLYTWKDLVNHITGIKLGEFVIMPNHFHGIIHIIDLETEWDDFIPSEFIFRNVDKEPEQAELVRAGSEPARTDASRPNPTNTNHSRTDTAHTDSTHTNHIKQIPLSEIVRQLKTFSARRINQARKTPGVPVWHRDYYEHIIRNQESYDQIVEYIQNNPMMWKMDKLFVE